MQYGKRTTRGYHLLKTGNMEFEQTEQQLTTAELAAFEQQFNIKLPMAFKEHYLKHNGGYPPYEYVKGIANVLTINGFYPIKYGRLPVEKIIADYGKNGIVFDGKIPFAYDNGGNMYLISLEADTYGHIFIIETEFLEDKNYTLVSKSFTDFLGSFH